METLHLQWPECYGSTKKRDLIQAWWGGERVWTVKVPWRGKTSIYTEFVWEPLQLEPPPWKRGWSPGGGVQHWARTQRHLPHSSPPPWSWELASVSPWPSKHRPKKGEIFSSLQGQLILSCSWAHWLSRGPGVSQGAHYFEQSLCSTTEWTLVLQSGRQPWLWPTLHSHMDKLLRFSSLMSPPLQGRSWASVQPPYVAILQSTLSVPEV